MGDELKNVIDLYNSSANLTSLYWNLFAAVVFGILGSLFTTKVNLSVWQRGLLCFVFIVFALANLFALINKQSMHHAMAYEVVEVAKVSVPKSKELKSKLSEVSWLPSHSSLHGTRWQIMNKSVNYWPELFRCESRSKIGKIPISKRSTDTGKIRPV